MPGRTMKCTHCGEEIPIGDYEKYGTSHTCPKCGLEVINWSDPLPDPRKQVAKSSEPVAKKANPQPAPQPKVTSSQEQVAYAPQNNKKPAPKNEYNPNYLSLLSVVFCLFLPWIIGFPFGFMGYRRAKITNDISGRRTAIIGMTLSVIVMIVYGVALIVLLWKFTEWYWGLISLFVVLIFYLIYFGITFYFHNH